MTSRLHVPVVGTCAFCAYLKGARPYTVLHRTDLTALLVTREQRGMGHLLIVPIYHRRTLLDLRMNEGEEIMRLLILAATAIDGALRPEGIAVWQNNGVPADQTIPHVHFHIAGTYPGRGTERGRVPELAIEETDQIAEGLRPWF